MYVTRGKSKNNHMREEIVFKSLYRSNNNVKIHIVKY